MGIYKFHRIVYLTFMKKALDEIVVETLNDYIKAVGLKQKELADLLRWSPQDLNDVLKRRKAIGAYRMTHLMTVLGDQFSQDLLQRLGSKKVLPENVAEQVTPYFYKNDLERTYVQRLFDILRGTDEQSILAVMASIDMGHRLRRERQKVKGAYIKQIKGVKQPDVLKNP